MNTQPACLTNETLIRIRNNSITHPEWIDLEEHLNHCEQCRARLESGEQDPDWTQEIKPALMTEEEAPPAILDPENPDQEADSLDHVLKLLGPTDNPHMLGRIGQYEVVGVVGNGGMGVVFKAFEPSLNRMVAIKMLLPHLAASPAARKRFAREGKAAAAVIDDHVMPIHGVSEWQGTPYLVMRYSPGPNLQKRVEKQGPLELEEILRIGTQTAKGLAAAHAQGLVHRDVKPSNILLDGTVERAMLTDFGLARAADDATLTRSGVLAGTPQYMSPEQVKGEQVDFRADLFGLGCVLYTLCTGKPPFEGENSYAILRQITDGAPRPIREINPRIPSWLCGLVERLMAKQPDKRPGSAQEVAEMLEGALAHVQQPETNRMPASLVSPFFSKSRFNRLGTGVLIMIATLFVGFGMLWLAQTEPSDIAGNWDGNEWGKVVLRKTGATSWEGTYSETSGKEPGTVAFKWSRIERRFNGTWNEGNDARFGELSLRLVDDSLVGAYTTDSKSRINPGTPKLADLHWIKVGRPGSTGGSPSSGAMAEKDKRIQYQDQRVDKLKEIGKAIHNYEATYGFLPPGNVRDANGRALYSWRVLLLPYVGESEIYKQWKMDQAWDSPANKPLSDKIVQAYADPEKPSNLTRFKVFVGENTAWIPGPAGWNQFQYASPKLIRFNSILDGTSNTLAAVEGRFEIPWAAPQDFDYNQAFLTSEIFPVEHGVLALMLDGSYRTLSNPLPKEVWNQLIVRNDVIQGKTGESDPRATFPLGSSGMAGPPPTALENAPAMGIHGMESSTGQSRAFHAAIVKSMGLPLKHTLVNEGAGILTGEGNLDFPWTIVEKSIHGVMELPATPTTAEEKKLARQRRLELLSNLIPAVLNQLENPTREQTGTSARPTSSVVDIPNPMAEQKKAQLEKLHAIARKNAAEHARLFMEPNLGNAPLYSQKVVRVQANHMRNQIKDLLSPFGVASPVEVDQNTNSLITRNTMVNRLGKLLDSQKEFGGSGLYEEKTEAILARLEVLETLKLLVENEKWSLSTPEAAGPSAKIGLGLLEGRGMPAEPLPEVLHLKNCPPEIGLTILVEWSRATGLDLVVPVTKDNGFRFAQGTGQSPEHKLSYILLKLADEIYKADKNPDLDSKMREDLQKTTKQALGILRISLEESLVATFLSRPFPGTKSETAAEDAAIKQRTVQQIKNSAKNYAHFWVSRGKNWFASSSPGTLLIPRDGTPEDCVFKLKAILKPFGREPLTKVSDRQNPRSVIYHNTALGNLDSILFQLTSDSRKDSDLTWEELKERWSLRMNALELLEGIVTGATKNLRDGGIDPGISRSKALDKLTQEKLARIGKALLDYHQKNGHLPPSHVLDREGHPLYSWQVLLLPYIGEDDLFKRWKLDEPWDSPNNKPLSDMVVDLFCEAGAAGTNKTPFRVFTGKNGLFDGSRLENLKKEGRTLKEVHDTLGRTILVIEAGKDRPWAEPKDIPTDNNEDLVELSNYQEGFFHLLWADGKTSSIPRTTRRDYLRMLASPNGGEVVPGFYESPIQP